MFKEKFDFYSVSDYVEVKDNLFSEFLTISKLKNNVCKEYLKNNKNIAISKHDLENEINKQCVLKIFKESPNNSIFALSLREELKSKYDLMLSRVQNLGDVFDINLVDGKNIYSLKQNVGISEDEYQQAIEKNKIHESLIKELNNSTTDNNIKNIYKNQLDNINKDSKKIISAYENQKHISDASNLFFEKLEKQKSLIKSYNDLISDNDFKSFNGDFKVYFLINGGINKDENAYLDIYLPKINGFLNEKELIKKLKNLNIAGNVDKIFSMKVEDEDKYIKVNYDFFPEKNGKFYPVLDCIDEEVSQHYYFIMHKLPPKIRLDVECNTNIHYKRNLKND